MIMKQATIKRMIERDLLREREDKPDAAQCHACGRSYLSRPTPRDSDDSGRFCSVRCRETYDAGMPAYEPNYVRRITNRPLGAWRVVAGPPGVGIGSCPWQQFLDWRPRGKRRRKVSSGPSSINSNFVENKPMVSVA